MGVLLKSAMPLELDEERRRRMDRLDRWLFLSIWLAIFAVTGIAVLLSRG